LVQDLKWYLAPDDFCSDLPPPPTSNLRSNPSPAPTQLSCLPTSQHLPPPCTPQDAFKLAGEPYCRHQLLKFSSGAPVIIAVGTVASHLCPPPQMTLAPTDAQHLPTSSLPPRPQINPPAPRSAVSQLPNPFQHPCPPPGCFQASRGAVLPPPTAEVWFRSSCDHRSRYRSGPAWLYLHCGRGRGSRPLRSSRKQGKSDAPQWGQLTRPPGSFGVEVHPICNHRVTSEAQPTPQIGAECGFVCGCGVWGLRSTVCQHQLRDMLPSCGWSRGSRPLHSTCQQGVAC
jgi:hypothetical protein